MKLNYVIMMSIPFLLSGCFIGAGTHGSIQGYQYNKNKSELENVVYKAFEMNSNVYRDTIGTMIISPKPGGGTDTTYDHGYNDGKEYITMQIITAKGKCKYTFRFLGGEEHWKSSNNSEIFICYAFDENHKGGSEGAGYDKKAMRRLVEVFELEFISKLDMILNEKHLKTK